MPYIRYRHWDTDGLNARKAIIANHEYVFLDADEGTALITNQRHAELLLRHESGNYEVAWDRYGVVFDAQGMELQEQERNVPVAAMGAVVGDQMGAAVGGRIGQEISRPPTVDQEDATRKPERPKRRS